MLYILCTGNVDDNIRIIRPGLGLKPKYYNEVLGKVAKHDIAYGTSLKLDYIS
jgi:pseudaminic acid synthase